jgi:RNase P subunit RPR2
LKVAIDDFTNKELLRLWDVTKSLGITKRELSTTLGCTLATLRSRLYRARKSKNKDKKPTVKPAVVSSKTPKILIYDIETSLMQFWAWRCGEQYLSPKNVVQDWNVICWAGKWLHEPETFGAVQTPKEAKNGDDGRVIKLMWDKFEEADIVVAHNGDKFDKKKMQYRFAINNLGPTLPFRSIDTLKIARSEFSATSNALDYLTGAFQLPQKTDTNIQLWKDCFSGNEKALSDMYSYNINDIIINEMLYLKLLPWIRNHPNVNLYNDISKQMCRNCGSDELIPSLKTITTSVNAYYTYRCNNCGHTGRYRQTVTTKDGRDNLLY